MTQMLRVILKFWKAYWSCFTRKVAASVCDVNKWKKHCAVLESHGCDEKHIYKCLVPHQKQPKFLQPQKLHRNFSKNYFHALWIWRGGGGNTAMRGWDTKLKANFVYKHGGWVPCLRGQYSYPLIVFTQNGCLWGTLVICWMQGYANTQSGKSGQSWYYMV